MIDVKSARYVSGYKVWVEFSNGESGVVDLESDLWGPVFEPLRDIAEFKKFTVSEVLHTLAWDNGADFAPEHLYEKATIHSMHAKE
jgi:hypothetical protein